MFPTPLPEVLAEPSDGFPRLLEIVWMQGREAADWSSDGDERATLAMDAARWRIATPRRARHEARASCGSPQWFGHASKTGSRVASDRIRTIGPACVLSKHADGHHQQHDGEKAERRLDPDPIQGAGRCVEPMAERGA